MKNKFATTIKSHHPRCARPELVEGFERSILQPSFVKTSEDGIRHSFSDGGQVQDERKRKKNPLLWCLFFLNMHAIASTIELTVAGAKNTKMPIAILLPYATSATSQEVANIIKKDLIFTDQFAPQIASIHNNISKKELATTITQLSSRNVPFALHIRMEPDNTITWRLYDTFQGAALKQKKYKPKNNIVRGWGHAIADNVYHALTGNEGFFSSRIAYCKEIKASDDNNKTIKHIYIADFDGSNEELLVDTPTINVVPRWNNNNAHPTLYYSEYTDTNVQLIATDMNKQKKVASNLDGTTMLVSFSPDKEKSIFCASKGKGNCQLFYQTKTALRPITNNKGNNVSPLFIDNNHICFCSDAQTRSPQLFIGNLETGHIQRITKGGYCTSPNYCATNNMLAYTMKVNGVMQLYTYSLATKEHTQITFGPENKHDVSWSPDGTHLLFAKEHDGKSYLALLNLSTQKTQRITASQDKCSYPHWSPYYHVFPTVKT